MQDEMNESPIEPSEAEESVEVTLATPGDRLLAYIVDALIFIGIAIVGVMPGVVAALVTETFENGDSDAVLLAILLIVIPSLYLTLAWTVFLLNMVARDGQTPGKKVVKIRIITIDGSNWGWGKTLVREALSKFLIVGLISGVTGWVLSAITNFDASGAASLIVSLVLFIWIVVDEKNQTLHDKIANTYVVKVQ